jgi:hypothetical protein
MVASGRRLEAEFSWEGLLGHVHVECVPNDDPALLGCWLPAAKGFPVCTATVQYPRRGYRGMFGWVQFVRSTDNASGAERYEMDPFALFGDAPSPYCWYGTEPTLFDAPSRETWSPLNWLAHSFLATTPMDELLQGKPRRVAPLTGFSWGFDLSDHEVTLRDLHPLTPVDWREHLPLLRATYPSPAWTFADDDQF